MGHKWVTDEARESYLGLLFDSLFHGFTSESVLHPPTISNFITLVLYSVKFMSIISHDLSLKC